ncbi:hypothetical protein [Pseudomonas sp. R5(2019)]|uniref:hypothetical protein n=1 Tax=Pseudomonas sp. R5(2019) TaxID=2697566 RepID=UPI001C49A3AF|nr:hypothetical protein [Pseudomonas sp. R5(2019)]NBA93885.1 hypothetical protein [Pseudomonas sp. R5(2019)]
MLTPYLRSTLLFVSVLIAAVLWLQPSFATLSGDLRWLALIFLALCSLFCWLFIPVLTFSELALLQWLQAQASGVESATASIAMKRLGETVATN